MQVDYKRNGGARMTEVRCSVQSCCYWSQGDICQADIIKVKSNTLGDADDELGITDMEAAEIGARAREASKSSETCCGTFRPKGTSHM